MPTRELQHRKDSQLFAQLCLALLREGHSVQFRVQGESMRPNILDGDAVVVVAAGAADVQRGDVVLTPGEVGLRVHRVAQVDTINGQVITRGDSGQENDPPARQIFGKVIAVDRHGRLSVMVGTLARLQHSSRALLHRLKLSSARRFKQIRSLSFLFALLLFFGALINAAPATAQSLTITDTAVPTTVAPGGTITYTQVLHNPSLAGITHPLTVSQNLPANTTYLSATKASGTDAWGCVFNTGVITCTDNSVGTYAAGGTTTFTVIVTVNAGVTDGTVITDTVNAKGANTVVATSSANVTVQTPDLSMTQGAAPNPVGTGADITYTESVTNLGPDAAVGATLTQTTPANTTFVSATAATGWTCGTVPAVGGTGTITCTANAAMASGTTTTNFTIVVAVNAAAPGGSIITNTATVSETGTDPNPGNNTTTASVTVSAADLSMTQTVSAPAVAPSGTITYTETVTNNGPYAAVTAVLYQQTPPNTRFGSMTPPAGWTCVVPAVGATGQVICTDGANLNSGTTTTNFTFAVTVNAGTAAGTTIVNSADVTSQTTDSVSSNNATTTSTLVEITGNSDLSLFMTAAPTPVFVSSALSYTIQLRNLGLAAATGVVVTDTLPATLANPTATTTQGSCAPPSGGQIVCTIGAVAYPLAAPIVITVSGTASATPGTLTNLAKVTTTGTDPVASNNSTTVLTVVQPLVCATPGKDGSPGAPLTGIVNTYYAGVGTAAAGTTTLIVTTPSSGSATQIGVGDLLLVIQMQDALINSTNTDSYGDNAPGDPASGWTSLGSSGQFEFVTVTAIIVGAPDTVTISGTGANGGLLNTYVSAAASSTQGIQTFQVIRVPQYSSAAMSNTLAALPWNGAIGGVLALDVASQLTLGGTVSLDGQGFRGAGGRILAGGAGVGTDDVTLSTINTNGSKGEGIAGTPHYIAPPLGAITPATTAVSTAQAYLEGLPNGSYARGAPGNAGGGATDADPPANDQNSGGGAGGNGGTGGIGGFGWKSAGLVGGFGGVAFPASTSAIVMGGGAGAGTTNNGSTWDPIANTGNSTSNTCPVGCTGIYSSGTAGGGIVIVHAGSVTGTGTITSSGQNALQVENDGGGGGGAGGTILVFANNGGLGGLTANAVGGNGGVTWPEDTPGTFPGNRHGPGGGGGGGVIFTSPNLAAANVSGGIPGWSTLANDPYGATAGQAGVLQTTHFITETPGTQSGAYCTSADLSVTNSGSPPVVLPGGTITYTQVVANNGPLDAVSAVFTQSIPANTAVSSITPPAGWTCATSAGTISCTPTSGIFPVNPTGVTFTVVVTVATGTASGTQIVDVANITSGTTDPNLANNTSIAVVTVAAAGTADLAINNAASPSTVAAGSNVTLTGVITNQGPSAAAGPVFTENIPPYTTFVSVSGPASWSCSSFAYNGTTIAECVDNSSLAVNSSATISVVVNVNAGTPQGTVITATDNVNSATVDPNYSNNSASTSFTVAANSNQADLAVTSSASPNPVTQGNNITYTQSVTNNGPATVTNGTVTSVTFTDTIPTNTTLVSFTPPPPSVWTCNTIAFGGTGTFTCTLNPGQTMLPGASVNFPLVVKVNPGTAAGATITNTANVNNTISSPCSATQDPNCANNTASTSVVVASPTQSSVTATKTAAPEPVNLGSTLTYTLTVTNSGPAVAQNVTVTDALPAEVTYVANDFSTTVGSCSAATNAGVTTVTCTLGNLAVGSTAVITINVTATTFSAATRSTNYATITSSTAALTSNVPNYPITVSSVSTIQASTAVDISSFQAFSQSDGSVVLEWRTHEESRNLGFHVYREDSSGRTRINPSFIAGSALLLRGSRPQHAAKIYRWIDPHPVRDAAYWIEDVDINGTRSTHGPAYVESPSAEVAATLASARSSALLSSQRASSVSPTTANPFPALAVPRPGRPIPPPGLPPLSVADHQAVKISVAQEGWYHVSFAQLFAAGLDRNTDSRTLHLYAEGVEQPLLLTGRASGLPSPTDAIEFYGMGIDTPFSADRVYWLISDYHSPKRILTVPAPVSGSTAPASFPFTVLREDRTIYFAALPNGENNDNFFGAIITSEPTDQELVVAHIDSSSALPISLDVALQGVTDPQEHRVTVQFNGATLGEMDFLGMALAQQTFPVDSSLLQNGTNTLTLTALNGDNDVNLVQSIALHYAHTYAADADWLRATASAGSELHFTGFTNPQVRVFDITDPLNIMELPAKISPASGAYGAVLALSTGGPAVRTILALANDAISAPVSLAPHVPTFLDDSRTGADVVIITHPDFVSSLAPLVRLRESQGHRISVVTTDQLFDEYNFGERSPFAIRSFLQEAASVWQRKPQSILLVGDASFDPRDYLGLGDFDFVPTRIIETAAFKTASDDWFTDFTQTGFATIPTGRLPVRTPADADLVISKIIGYERGSSAGSWNSQALLIADQNSDSNFTAAAASAAATLPATLQVSEIFADSLDTATARSQILAALNNGALLVDYSGHGAEQQWSFADLFDTADAAALSNGARLPVYLLMNCLNGFFHDVYAESLAESLLLAPNGGAVAVWASSGFTQQPPQSTLNQAFLHLFAGNPNQSLGRLVLQAKAGATDNDVRRTWILFGDPAMKIQFAPAAIPANTSAPKSQPVATPVNNRPCLPESVCLKEKQRQ